MFKKFSIKRLIVFSLILLMTVTTIVSITVSKKIENYKISLMDPEDRKAISYSEFGENAADVNGTDNVKFSAFFLQDLNNDGYAEKVNGKCLEIGTSGTLYMELSVLSEGVLENAQIEINGQNIYLYTAIPRDEEIMNNAIGHNTQLIQFNSIQNGTQKMLSGFVRSGDYSKSSTKNAAIGTNINNYSNTENKIILTGTYVDNEGNRKDISKEIKLTVDWFGENRTSINSRQIQDHNYDPNIASGTSETVPLSFEVRTSENLNELLTKGNYVECVIPQLNGYDPISVTTGTGNNITSSYNPETHVFRIEKESVVNDEGNITSLISTTNTYNITINYPRDAINANTSNIVELIIPVSEYYEGYNNDEFENPKTSNIARTSIIATYPLEQKSSSQKLSLTIGKYISNPYSDYVITKTKPYNIYDGISLTETNDTYPVVWSFYTGTNGVQGTLTITETKRNDPQKVDEFINSSAEAISLEEITRYKSATFTGLAAGLDDDGMIYIINEENNNYILELSKEEALQYKDSNPFIFPEGIKHIRVEFTKTNPESSFGIAFQKELDDEYITNHFTREEFDNLKMIRTNVTAYSDNLSFNYLTKSARYEQVQATASISLDNNVVSTQATERNNHLTITAKGSNEGTNTVGWVDGIFLVKVPNQVAKFSINGCEIDNPRVNLVSYELFENSNGKFIKIYTSNTLPEEFNITIDYDISADPRIPTQSGNFVLYAKNNISCNYIYRTQDIYDLNGNSNTTEAVNTDSVGISFVSPSSMITTQMVSQFDGTDTIVISPEIADLEPAYADIDNENKTAKIGVQIRNNYSGIIDEVKILGKIPFENNTDVLKNTNLGSSYTAQMKDSGIEIPEEIRNVVTVYYSTSENPNTNLADASNNWVTADGVTDWTQVKTFLIDFGNYSMASGKEFIFYYQVEVPVGLEYNQVSFSHHGVYFSLNTDEGRYRTKIAPNYIGLRIAKKYDLQLTKYQYTKPNVVQGAIYGIREFTIREDETGDEIIYSDETITQSTNNLGILTFNNLYAEKYYEIREIVSPEDYELNPDTIKFIAHVDDSGNITVEKLEGTTKVPIYITKNENEPHKVNVEVEDEVKLGIKVIKSELNTDIRLSKSRFKIIGPNYESGRIISTNTSGEAILTGLSLGQEYTIQEIKSTEGYYLDNQVITFKVKNNGGTYEIETYDGNIKNYTLTTDNNKPVLVFEWENEKIPTYNMVINKISKDDGLPLEGATFKLFYEDKEVGTYVTDAEGKMYINNLYLYVPEKIVEQEYVLKEYQAPEGFSTVKDIHFFVQKNNENILELTSDSVAISAQEGTDSVITITVEDRKSFVLIKEDEDTGERLQGAKFAIYNIDNGLENPTEAVDVRGNRVGNYEVVNGEGYYLVETNSEGMVSLLLPEGAYKAVEIVASDEKYDLSNENLNVHYFGIGTNVRFSEPGQYLWSSNAYGEPTMYLDDMEGYVIEGSKVGLRKYNTDGSVMWEFPIGNVSYLFLDKDDKYIVNVGNKIYKYDKFGNVEWENPTSGQVKCMCSTADGGYCAIEGSTLKRYDSTFNVIWTVTGMGTHNSSTVREDVEGNIITQVGQSISKFDNTGTRLWNKSVSIAIIRDNPASSAMIIDEEGYLIGGQNGSNIVCTKLDPSGNEIYTKTIATGFNFTHYTAVNNDNELLFGFEYDNYSGGPGGIYTRPRVAIITADGEVKTMFGVYQNWEGTQGTRSCIYCFGGGRFNYATRLQNAGFIKEDGSTLGAYNTIVYSAGAASVQDTTELIVKNRVKKYRISTKVEPYEGVNGGTISGDGVYAYEMVNYQEDSIKDIVITPDEGYKILSLTINGKKVQFTSNPDGTYTLPKFTNMLEDKIIVVKFIKIENTLVIKKEDSETRNRLQGATFRFEQIEERPEPEQTRIGSLIENNSPFYYPDKTQEESGVIGEIVDNGPSYVTAKEDAVPVDTTNIFGELTSNGSYYFVDNGQGALISTNSKTYQTANGGTTGAHGTVANSYIKIDLSEYDGSFRVGVDAYNQSEGNCDFGYATITSSTNAPTYTSSQGRFIYLHGTASRKEYYSNVLEGGNIYYLHFGYRKDGSVDSGTDAILIYNIKLYDNDDFTDSSYGFELNEDNCYINTNNNIAQTKAASYIPIDLTGKEGKYGIVINAEQAAVSNNSGYIAISQNTANTTSNAIYSYSGNVNPIDKYQILDGGRIYYVHLTFNNNNDSDTVSNIMKINSINVYKAQEMFFSFEKNDDDILVSTNKGYDNSTSYSIIPIDLTGLDGKYNLIVNANISSQSGSDIGFATVTQNTNRVSYNSTTGRFIYLSGTSTAAITPKDYPTVLQGGNLYYLHIGYYKNASSYAGEDEFYINSIRLELNESEIYNTEGTTDENGILELQLPHGLYNVYEDQAPVGYKPIASFTYRMEGTAEKELIIDNIAYKQVVVHHYYKDNDGNYTTIKVAEDNILYGEVGERYTTSPILDMVEYDLEKDNNGDYVIPSNATGTFTNTPIEVNYYYTNRKPVIIVNHYIEGTSTKVPLKDGTPALSETREGEFGQGYTTAQVSNDLLADEYEIATVPTNAVGTYTEYEEIINYYYKLVQRKVTIQKYDEDGVTPLGNVKFEIDGLKDRVDISGAINNGTYYMKKDGDRYVSNNKGVHNSTADTYFKIDMTNAAYNVVINANVRVSSQGSTTDFGYMYVTESPDAITATEWNSATGRVYKNGGSRSAENVTPYTLRPGKMYYLHIGYHKNGSSNYYNDEFIVNSINYTIGNKAQYTTNNEGKFEVDLNTGSYDLYEVETLPNYNLDSTIRTITIDRNSTDQTISITNTKTRGTVIVNYYKEGTTDPIILADGTPAQSETKTNLVGEMYATTPASNVSDRYDLVGIPENASGEYIDGEIVVNYYYHENMSNVKVHYYIEGTTTSLVPDVNIPGYVTQSYSTESSPDIPTYYHLVAEPSNKNGVITRDETVVTYYYALNSYNYTTEYYYDGVIDNSKTYSRSATYGDSVSTYDDKNIPGYRFDHTNDLPIVIGEDESENVIRVYYVKDDFGYTVEYYYDGVIDDSKTENYTATFQDLIETYEDKNIPGYKFDHTDKFPLRITEVAANNVIKVYYVKDDFAYTVEYYYDGTIDNSKTENYTATFQDLIETYVDKNIPGYKFDHTDKFPLRITEVAENNVIKVYYEKDNFGYRVEYYYDGAIDNSKTENYTATFQDLIETYVDKNIPGYKFDHTDKFPLSITEVAENNVIKVYYVKDDFGYRVEYYYDGTIDNSKTENYTATFQDLIETYVDKNITGYKFDHTDKLPLRITEVAENNVIKVYYVKDDFGYRVEYYYDETIDNSKTENYTATFQDLIETYEDKVIDGYRLDHTDKFPLRITEVADNNVIKVYYVKRTDLSYVVNYLEKGTNAVLSTQKTVPNQRFGDTIISTSEKIDIDGYYFDSPEKPEIVIKTDLTQNVINLYYTKRTDLKYTVYYFEKGTNKPIDTSKVVENQRYLDEIDTSIEIKPIYGYNYDSIDPTTLTIDYNEDNNIIRIYYTKKPTSVLVRYLEQGTDAPLSAEVTIPGLVFDHYETEEAIDIPDKYYLVSEPANKTGEMTEEQIVVTYYYSKKSSKIIVRYVDMVTNDELVPHDEITKVVDQTYETTPKDIADYKVSYDTGNTTGTVTVDPIEVIYYYAHDAYVYVHFVEKSTGNTLAPDETIKDVEGTPYKAESKEIRRYKLIESELPTNAEGTMTREPITVTYYYEFDTAFVEVHHKDNLYDGDLVPMTTIDGAVGDDYSTEPISIPNYDLVEEKLPDNASGQMTKEKITVNYYYAKISSVTVKYIDRNTGEELADPVFIPGHEGDEYHSTALNIDDYILVSEPENKDGLMPYDPTEIIYYYAIESAGVIEKHIDEMSNELLYNELHPGNVGDEYNIESRDIENYAVDENLIPDNKHGYMTEEPIEVIYYYRYLTPITVEYIDRETGEKLIDDINTTGYEGENYVTEEKTFPDYKLVEIPTNKEGILTKDPVVVKYYYAHDSAGVIVHYIDEQTNKEIAEKVVIPGQEGDPYETIAKTIENYELNSEKYPTNNKGKMTKDLIEVYYYYTPKAQVIIEYIDKETGERIEEVIKDGYVGDEYHSNPKYFDLYQIIEEEIPENKDGVMKKETITVRYYYHKKAQVVVEHIDRHTNEVIETSYIYGYENDEYYTSSRDFENYSLIESELPTNREGTMTREHITYVKYYYERRGQVIVEYRDVNTNQLITTSDVINGKVGDNYTTKEKDIYGYKLVVDKYPDNSSGLFKDKTITVTYYYDRVYTDGDIVINNNNNNVVTIVSGPKFEEEITRVVIPDNTPQNRVVQKPITVVPTPSPVNNTVENNSSTIIYNVPNTEKNSHYQLAAIMMISLGWYIVVRNKQDEK